MALNGLLLILVLLAPSEASSSSDDAQQNLLQKSVTTELQKSVTTDDYVHVASSKSANSFFTTELDRGTTELDMKMMMDKRLATRTRIEDLVAYQDNGQAAATMVGKAYLATLSAAITSNSYKQQLSDFVTSAGGSRYIKNEGNSHAAEYLKKKFQDMGYEVHELPWEKSIAPDSVNNIGSIVAFKKGQDPSNEAVLLGAHFDSVNWKDTSQTAPGVDDNGSGIAGLLSIAESLKGQSPSRNVVLAAFNAEEEGLLGSKSFAETVVHQNKLPQLGNIKGALIMDEIAFPGRNQYTNQAIFETVGSVEGSQNLVDTLAHHVDDSQGAVSNFQVNWHGFGSDHISLSDAKIPSLLVIERDDEWHADQVAHSDKDTFSGLSMDYGAAMSRLVLRAYVALLNPSTATETSSVDSKAVLSAEKLSTKTGSVASKPPASANLRSAHKFVET